MTELAPGFYLGLPEERYFAQSRLGSTDMSKLHTAKEGWWWSSKSNPDYVDEPEDAKPRTFGKALHALILEGDAAYAERFAVITTKEAERAKWGDRFCVTVGDMQEALEARGMNPKGGQPKQFYAEVCRSRAPDIRLWDDIEAAWRRDNEGKLPVSAAEDRQLRIMTNAVRNHKDVGHLFTYGADNVPITEASVFWDEPHGSRIIKRRARFDALLPQQCIDLKTLSNVGQRPLNFGAGDHLAKFGYHVQMADHGIARKWAYRFIQEGRLYGGTPEQRAWVSRYPKDAPDWEFVLMMYQRPDNKKGVAPIVFPWIEERGTDLHRDGIRARRKAIQLYLQCIAQFGENEPWTRVEPVHSSVEGAAHRVFLPAHIAEEPVPGEDEDL